MRDLLKGTAIALALFILLLILIPAQPVTGPTVSRGDQVKAGCAEQFPGDEVEQRRCVTEIRVREYDEARRDAVDRAAG